LITSKEKRIINVYHREWRSWRDQCKEVSTFLWSVSQANQLLMLQTDWIA